MSEIGLYMAGQISINSKNNKRQFAVKIGMSQNITKRISQYKSYNPFIEVFAIAIFPKSEREWINVMNVGHMEHEIHKYMEENLELTKIGKTEWFEVSENQFQSLTQNTFDIFQEVFEKNMWNINENS